MYSDSIFGCLFFMIESHHVHSDFWANLGYRVRLKRKKSNGMLGVGEMAQRVKALVAAPDGPLEFSLGVSRCGRREPTLQIVLWPEPCAMPWDPLLTTIEKCSTNSLSILHGVSTKPGLVEDLWNPRGVLGSHCLKRSLFRRESDKQMSLWECHLEAEWIWGLFTLPSVNVGKLQGSHVWGSFVEYREDMFHPTMDWKQTGQRTFLCSSLSFLQGRHCYPWDRSVNLVQN